MRSMTGFGLGEAPVGTGKLGIEIRGVNHRYLDVRVRAVPDLADLVAFVEQIARERLSRGRYDVSVRVDGNDLGVPTLDRERAKRMFLSLCELRDEIAPGSDVPFSVLASIPDLFTSPVPCEREKMHDATRGAFEAAADALDGMREREGAILREDLAKRIGRAEELTRGIARRAPEMLETQRRRLVERVDRLRKVTEVDVDGGRIEQEVALLAERCDIAEELTRLSSHRAQFEDALASTGPIGRRLDFLLQEMIRETNTVGAKSLDAQIAHAVIELKIEIERMREQVQNVE